jgi:glycosyltransferase involved in cell wall biosynthesis
MRVLFYHGAPDWNGSARAFASMARVMAQRGYQVTYACPADSLAERRASYSGFEVIPVETGGTLAGDAFRLKNLLVGKFVEVICVHTARDQLVCSIATRLAERGAVVRRLEAGQSLRTSAGLQGAMRLAASGYLYASPGELAAAPSLPRAIGSWVVPLGVDLEAYDEVRPAPRPALGAGGVTRLAVCLYDVSARARIGTVLRTIALLSARHPDLRLAMIGRGSDDEALRMHAAALGITGVVSHLGERDDAQQVMRAADVGWVVADGDDAAFATLDFMAMRIPVLAERGTIAQRYVADNITGLLLPPGDAPASAAALAAFLHYDEQRAAMGNAARLRVGRDFALAPMGDALQRAVDAARDRSRWVA